MTHFVFCKKIVTFGLYGIFNETPIRTGDCLATLKREKELSIELPPIGYGIDFKDGSCISVEIPKLTEDSEKVRITEEIRIYLYKGSQKANEKIINDILRRHEENWDIETEKDWQSKL